MHNIISRREAVSLNLDRYFTGKICKHGHIVERYTSNGVCIACCDIKNKNSKEYFKKYLKEYRKTSKWKNYNKEYQAKHSANDINFRLANRLRTRINRAIKINQRKGSAVRDLGCSIDNLKKYLTNDFSKEMTWENYGKVWEIDHKLPLSKFNLSNREEFLEACHYTNLQPLIIYDNRHKYNNQLLS